MTLQRMVITLVLTASCTWLAIVSASTTYNGYGTVYSLSSPFDGNCNFMSWPDDAVTKYAALNADQWEETMNCGRCAEVSCTDASCSGHSEIVYIMDQCPGCDYGDLDLSPSVFESITGQSYTKLSIEWKFVDCPIKNNVQYCLKTGSSEFWVAVQPTNFVSGVESLSINGQKTTMIDSAYYFLIDGCGTSVADLNSVSISMKGVNGEEFEERLSLTADECTDGSWQFVSSGDTFQTTIQKNKTSSITNPTTPTPTPNLTLASPSAGRATFLNLNVTIDGSYASHETSVVTNFTNAGTDLVLRSDEESQSSSVSKNHMTALAQTSSITQTATTFESETSRLMPASMPITTMDFEQEEASSSNSLHSTAAIVAVLFAALGVVGSMVMVVHKKRKMLEEGKTIDNRSALDLYVSVRSPKSEVPVVYSAV